MADTETRVRAALDGGFPLARMAREAGISPETLRQWRDGNRQTLRADTRKKLAAWLGTQNAGNTRHTDVPAPPNPSKPAPRAFTTDAERIAYALGALDAAERYRVALGVELQVAVAALSAPGASAADDRARDAIRIRDLARGAPPPEALRSAE